MGIKLLLADDSATIGKILSMALQSESYEIKSVLTADDAIKELRANPPFFFLVDLTLPNKNGYDFAKLIRSDSKLNKIKVVLLSSAFDPVDPQKLEECGADGYVVKPFDPSELRKKLRDLADAPPKFPSGFQVQGSMSGTQVNAPGELPPLAPPTTALEELSLDIDEGDADAILSQLMKGSDEEKAPLSEQPITNPSLSIDTASHLTAAAEPVETILDLSQSFPNSESTATIDLTHDNNSAITEHTFSKATVTPLSRDLPPAFSVTTTAPSHSAAAPMVETPPQAPLSAKADEPLSANAQALAAFFEAELDHQSPPASPPTTPLPSPQSAIQSVPHAEKDAFDASTESIEWASPAKESLDSWSSNAPSFPPPGKIPAAELLAQTPPTFTPPPKNVREATKEITSITTELDTFAPPPFTSQRDNQPPQHKPGHSLGAGASAAGNPLFDTGGSNFVFADDYIQRITKAFSGAIHEAVPKVQEGLLHSESQDIPPSRPASIKTPAKTPAPPVGGGAWNPDDAQKIEQLVREEVQMIVREVVEKVAWEVIPELAENIIKKELEKVLKQMEGS